MAQMTPEEMKMLQEKAGKGGGEGPATALAKQVGQGLQKLSEMLAQSGGSEEEMAQMKQIMDLYIDLVEAKLGGAEPETQPAGKGEVPMEAGVSGGQSMGPQTRN